MCYDSTWFAHVLLALLFHSIQYYWSVNLDSQKLRVCENLAAGP